MCQQSPHNEAPLTVPLHRPTTPPQNDLAKDTELHSPPKSPTTVTTPVHVDPNPSSKRTSTRRHRDTLLHRTMTLYDWDDTFFPSTYLAARGLRIDDPNQPLPATLLRDLQDLELIVIKSLQQALTFGVVKVITNAEEGWVELSGARFMPRLVHFLRDHDIKVVSARTLYEADFPHSPSSWKTAAFAAEVDDSFPDVDRLNVLVLGDSLSERDAAHHLASRMPMSCIKSVKLVERPNVTQLQRQIALLHGSFRDLREHYGSFDVNLTC